MHILGYAETEIKDECANGKGDHFSSVIRLKGEYTLGQLRALMGREFVPRILNDFADRYHAVFIEPDSVRDDPQSLDQIDTDVMIANFGQRGMMQFVDERLNPSYGGACFHTHSRDGCTSALGIEDGVMPTIFIRDHDEFIELVGDHASDVGDIVDLKPSLSASGTSQQKSIAVSEAIFSAFSSATRPLKARLLQFQDRIKQEMAGKIVRFPKKGSISVFRGDVVHAGHRDPEVEGNPGVLLVQNWKKKPR